MITIENCDKIRIAKTAANQLFCVDYDVRQSMTNQELIETFDLVWSIEIEQLILHGSICKYEEVISYFTEEVKHLINPIAEYRRFRYRKVNFIVQLQPKPQSGYYLTNLWRITSKEMNPKTLLLNFSSFEEKELFQSLAAQLKMEEKEVAIRLIRLFINIANDAIENNDNQALSCLNTWFKDLDYEV